MWSICDTYRQETQCWFKDWALCYNVKCVRPSLDLSHHFASLYSPYTLGTKSSSIVFKTSRVQISNNCELLSKPRPWMWHLMCGNHVRNGSDRKPKTRQNLFTKTCTFENSYRRYDVYTTTPTCRYSLNQHKGPRLDRRFLLHLNAVLIICVITDSTVLCVVLHTVHRNFQKCNFWWMHSACFGPSIAAISHTISAHKVSH